MSEIRTRDAQGKLTKLVVDYSDEPPLVFNGVTMPRPEIQKEINTFTYYSNGDIDTIVIKKFDAAGAVLFDKTLKHFQNGKQPEFI